jgi:hypothetical protein
MTRPFLTRVLALGALGCTEPKLQSARDALAVATSAFVDPHFGIADDEFSLHATGLSPAPVAAR